MVATGLQKSPVHGLMHSQLFNHSWAASRNMKSFLFFALCCTSLCADETNVRIVSVPATETAGGQKISLVSAWIPGKLNGSPTVQFAMRGTVTNVMMVDGRIHFQLIGAFWFHQREAGTTNQQIIKAERERGFSIAVTPSSFSTMLSEDYSGAMHYNEGRLLPMLQMVAERGTTVQFCLLHPQIDFGTNGFTLTDARIESIIGTGLR